MSLLKKNGGFTLVELIVVIAILAILAGVAVPAYSGYVEKANMQADITLAKDVAQALTLQYYSHPTDSRVASVAIGTGGVTTTDQFAIDAMVATFGTGYADTVKLTYDKWGSGAAVSQSVIDRFSAAVDSGSDLAPVFTGEAKPSYAEQVDDLFVELKDTSILVGNNLNKSGAELLQGAAGKTTGAFTGNVKNFTKLWATKAWDSSFLMEGTGASYGSDAGSFVGDAAEMAVANAAIIKARNASLATYLKNKNYGDEVYNIFFNYNYEKSSVPRDAAGLLMNGDDEVAMNALMNNLIETGANMGNLMADMEAYFEEGGQAEKDALAYYAMMDTVQGVNNTNGDDATYWDDMSGAVSIYGAIASGDVSLEKMKNTYGSLGTVPANSVVVTLIAANGKVATQISPNTANPTK